MKGQLHLILCTSLALTCGACSSRTTPAATNTSVIEPTSTRTAALFDSSVANRAEATLNALYQNSESVQRNSTVTATPSPTKMMSPTPTITPISVVEVEAHPLALNESNIYGEMELLARFGRGSIYDVAWSPDGKYLAVATGLGVQLYDAKTLDEERWIEVNDSVTFISFNPDDSEIAAARGNRIDVWYMESGQKKATLDGEIAGGVWRISFGGDGYVAAIGSSAPGLGWDPEVNVWQSSTGQLIYHEERLFLEGSLAISPDGEAIAFLNGLYSIDMKDLIRSFSGGFDVVFSQDGSKLFSTYWDFNDTSKDYKVWMIDRETGEQARILPGAHCPYLSRTGESMICYDYSEIIVFDPMDGERLGTYSFRFHIDDAAINVEGDRLAILEGDSLHIWDVRLDHEIQSKQFDRFTSLGAGEITNEQPDTYLAATGDDNGLIKIWNLASGEVLVSLNAGEEGIAGLAFSPDQRTLASIDTEAIVRLWDFQRGKNTGIHFELGEITSRSESWEIDGPFEFSSDGQRLIYFDRTREMYELNVQTGINELKAYAYRNGIPYEVDDELEVLEAFTSSADGRFAAGGRADGKIFVWDLKRQKFMREMSGHVMQRGDGPHYAFHSLKFSPKSNLLVSVGWDGTTKLWNIHTGNPIRVLNVCCFAEFSPDGRFLITAGNGVIRLWGIPPWSES